VRRDHIETEDAVAGSSVAVASEQDDTNQSDARGETLQAATGTFLNDIIPWDRKTPIDTEKNPHTLPDLPALNATIRPAGVRRGKVNYTVDELPEIGRTTAPEIEAARRYLLNGEHPERLIDIKYPEQHYPEWPGITSVTHGGGPLAKRWMLKEEAERFIDPNPSLDLNDESTFKHWQFGGTHSVYLTRREILTKKWEAYNESRRRLHERPRQEYIALHGDRKSSWTDPYEPVTFERWKEMHEYTDAHPDKYKHHGAIPGTAKIVRPLSRDEEDGFRIVTVVWQTKPTAADVRKARVEWEESLPRPDSITTLADAARLREDDADGYDTRKRLRKEGFTVEKYAAAEEFREQSEASWEQNRALRRWSWIGDEANQGRLPYLVRGFWRRTKHIPRATLGKLLAQKIRRGVEAAKIGRPLDPLAEHAWDLEHGFAKVTKPERRILDAGGTYLDAATERAKLDVKNAAKLDAIHQKALAAKAVHDAWRRRGFGHWIAERGASIPWDATDFIFEGERFRLNPDVVAGNWRGAGWLTEAERTAWSERSPRSAKEDAELWGDNFDEPDRRDDEWFEEHHGRYTDRASGFNPYR
jgi:hypothetical protein